MKGREWKGMKPIMQDLGWHATSGDFILDSGEALKRVGLGDCMRGVLYWEHHPSSSVEDGFLRGMRIVRDQGKESSPSLLDSPD